MFCNKCGNKLSDDATFCNKCGNKLEANDKINDANAVDAPVENQTVSENKAPKKKKSKIKLILLLIAVVIVAAIVTVIKSPSFKIAYKMSNGNYEDAVEEYGNNYEYGESSMILDYGIKKQLQKVSSDEIKSGNINIEEALEIVFAIERLGIEEYNEQVESAYEQVAAGIFENSITNMGNVKSASLNVNSVEKYTLNDDNYERQYNIESYNDLTNNIVHSYFNYERDKNSKNFEFENERFIKIDTDSRDLYIKEYNKWYKQLSIPNSKFVNSIFYYPCYGYADYLNIIKLLTNIHITETDLDDDYALEGELKLDYAESSIPAFEDSNKIELTAEDRTDANTNLAPVKVSIYINKETLLPSSMLLDVTDYTTSLCDNRKKLQRKYNVKVDDYNYSKNIMSIEFGNYDNVEEITIPSDAFNGKDTETVK